MMRRESRLLEEGRGGQAWGSLFVTALCRPRYTLSIYKIRYTVTWVRTEAAPPKYWILRQQQW